MPESGEGGPLETAEPLRLHGYVTERRESKLVGRTFPGFEGLEL
jgi:hypothetical protein